MPIDVKWRHDKDWGVVWWWTPVVVHVEATSGHDRSGTAKPVLEWSRRTLLRSSAPSRREMEPNDDAGWTSRSIVLDRARLLPVRYAFTAKGDALGKGPHHGVIWVVPGPSVVCSGAIIGACGIALIAWLWFVLRTITLTMTGAGIGIGGGLVGFFGFWLKSVGDRARAGWEIPHLGVGLMFPSTLLAATLVAPVVYVGAEKTAEDFLVTFVNKTGGPLELPHGWEGALELPPERHVTITSRTEELACTGSHDDCHSLEELVRRFPDPSKYCFRTVAGVDSKGEWVTLSDDGLQTCHTAERLDGEASSASERTAGPADWQLAPVRVEVQCAERPWADLGRAMSRDATPTPKPEPWADSAWYDEKALHACAGAPGMLCLRMKHGCKPADAYWAKVPVARGVRRALRNGAVWREDAAMVHVRLGSAPGGESSVAVVREDDVPALFIELAAISGEAPLGSEVVAPEFALPAPASATFFDIELLGDDRGGSFPAGVEVPQHLDRGRLRCTTSRAGSAGTFELLAVPWGDRSAGLAQMALFRAGESWRAIWSNARSGRPSGKAWLCVEDAVSPPTTLALVLRPVSLGGVGVEIPQALLKWLEPTAEGQLRTQAHVELYRSTSNPDAPKRFGTSDCPVVDRDADAGLRVVQLGGKELSRVKAIVEPGRDRRTWWTADDGEGGPPYVCTSAADAKAKTARVVVATSRGRRDGEISVKEEAAAPGRSQPPRTADLTISWNRCWVASDGRIHRDPPAGRRCGRGNLAEFHRVNPKASCDEVFECGG